MKKIILSVLVVGLLGGCAVHVQPVATGGSKADGIVELSFEYGDMQKPIINEAQSLLLAEKRCNAWGYSKAEKFGGSKQSCASMTGFGCARFLVTVPYQCLD